MKQCIVANFRKNKTNSAKQYDFESLATDIRAQIDNYIDLGLDTKDLFIITNFPFCYRNVGAIQMSLNEDCLTGSKLFATRELFRHRMIKDDIWVHDLDAWQNIVFDFPKIKEIGLSQYTHGNFAGGSMFFNEKSEEIVNLLVDHLENNKEHREEPTLDLFFKSGKLHSDKCTVLNWTYNLGCSAYNKRYVDSEKPIKVCHFHPTNRLGWDTHCRSRYGIGISVSDRLRKILLKHYGETIDTYTYPNEEIEPTGPRNVRKYNKLGEIIQNDSKR
jgi:hypothetical protein